MEMAKLAKQNILATGGTGFVGRYAIKRLVEDGHRVYALVRSKEKLLNVLGKGLEPDFVNAIEIERPETLTVADLKQIIEENEITTIIHVAGIVGEHKISWDKYFEVNVMWTKNLALSFLGADVNHDKFVFTSSVGVYGTIPKLVPANEKTQYNPDGSYHKSKVLAEQELLCLQSSSNLPLIILRPTILYGNEDKGFLYKFFRLMGKKIFPLCSSNPRIHLLDVALLADTYAELVKWSYVPKDCIFNVGDGESVEIRALSQYIDKSMDAGYLKIPSFVFTLLTKLSTFNRQYSVSLKLISKSWFYDVDKLYKTFNLKSTDTIQSLDKKYIAWYKGAADIG
jgi:nucleoside-diphosphate-sugar epimerase